MVSAQPASTLPIDKAQALKQLELLGTAERFDFDSTEIPAYLIDAEEDILGCILMNPEAIEQVKYLPLGAFTQAENRRIFMAAITLHQEGKSTDLMSVTSRLYDQGILADAGGQSHLGELIDRRPCMGALDVRVQLLQEKYFKRELAKIRVTPENLPQVLDHLQTLNQTVSVDSQQGIDGSKPYSAVVSATVNSVNKILDLGLVDFEEQSELDNLQKTSSLSKAAFWQLVAAARTRLDEVQPSDRMRLGKLIDWSGAALNFEEALPTMAADILHDARVLNIDPIAIWQYLMPAVLSLAGKKISLDLDSHKIPAIGWTAIVAESGAGKTRAEKLVMAPLKALQAAARVRFQEEMKAWKDRNKKEDKKSSKPSTEGSFGDGGGDDDPIPTERKYLFEVATIQAAIRRLSEQVDNGTLWARDELAGLFKSFGQFSKGGDQEGLECMLKLWDGDGAQVDRVRQDDSFFMLESRLSVAGGIQPGAFRQAFRDRDDSQGLQARFLFASAKTLPFKRTTGYCLLSEKLPTLYNWLDKMPEASVRLSKSADNLYTKLYEEIGRQALETALPSVRAWMFKLPTHLLRIALCLHLIEVFHNRAPLGELQIETLKRAVLFAQYYRASFQVLQEKTVDSDEISSILLKIWDMAVTKHPDGISTRDAYRAIRAIQYRAKDAGRSASAYTADLFSQLADMGKGQVVKQGRVIKFIAGLNPDQKQDRQEVLPLLTVPEMVTQQAFQVSTDNEVSTLTLEDSIQDDPPIAPIEEEIRPVQIVTPSVEAEQSTQSDIQAETPSQDVTPSVEPIPSGTAVVIHGGRYKGKTGKVFTFTGSEYMIDFSPTEYGPVAPEDLHIQLAIEKIEQEQKDGKRTAGKGFSPKRA